MAAPKLEDCVTPEAYAMSRWLNLWGWDLYGGPEFRNAFRVIFGYEWESGEEEWSTD